MKLFTDKRFLPLFVTQFFGAFNDNLFKQVVLFIITYKIVSISKEQGAQYTFLATALFILPYFLFSAFAGQLADKFSRDRLCRYIKLWEIGLALISFPVFYFNSVIGMMTVLFFLGMQSTFFSPLKYSLLPQHLHEDELLSGNAYMEAGTYLAILLGSLSGMMALAPAPKGEMTSSAVLLGCAVIGYLSSRYIPVSDPPSPELRLNPNLLSETFLIIRSIYRQTYVWRSVLGVSAFWLVGALYMSQLPNFCRYVLNADGGVVSFFLAVFSIGIGTGAFLCNRLLKGIIQATYVPLAALLMAFFTLDLYFASNALNFVYAPGNPVYLPEFLHRFFFWRITLDMFFVAVSGGLFTVPLCAIMQHSGDQREMARIIAGNNIINSLFMAGGTILMAAAMWMWSLSIPHVFLVIAAFNMVVAVYVCSLLPDALFRSIVRLILWLCYRVEIDGMEHYEKAGSRVMIIANHTSLLDGLLIGAFMPEKITFAINKQIAERWYIHPLLRLVNIYPMDPTSPMAIKNMIREVQQDVKVMIFPEGRITVTGSLMKIYEGPGLIADKTGAMILPVRIEGAQYSSFSYLKKKLKTRLFPKITLTVLPPRKFELPMELTGRERRQAVSRKIYDIMTEMMYHSSHLDEHLFRSLKNAARLHGHKTPIAEDIKRRPLTYGNLIQKSYVVGTMLQRTAPGESRIGLMLPTSAAAVVTFFGAQTRNLIPCMINFTSGGASILSGCKASGIRTIVTSRQFLEQAKLLELESELVGNGLRVICLEDLVEGHLSWKLAGLFRWIFGVMPRYRSPDQQAVILFTSGSEGTPKAVVLSHKNLQANRHQVCSIMPISSSDRIFNCLPVFHSFGLSMGLVLPILSGIRTFFYPSPLHYRIVPELCYDTNTTILFGTDTFMYGYGRSAHPYDFFNLRIALVGAERIKDTTRALWMDKFGIRLFSGYGTTEAAPVVSVDTPMYFRLGTVGRPLPGLETKLLPVPGVDEGGRLLIRGENIMLGYYRADNPLVLEPPPDGWYDTGDIVRMDGDGFITIAGRAKRFAKIGGEMVSLTMLEEKLALLYPDSKLAVDAVDNERKGEQIVLFTECEKTELASLVDFFRANKISELAIPKRIVIVPALPLLGTGKIDYKKLKELL